MPTTISSLPPEILFAILSILNPFDLENVARTFNQQLYYAARPLLAPLLGWIRSSRRMTSLFPCGSDPNTLPPFPGNLPPFKIRAPFYETEMPTSGCDRLGLDPAAGPYIHSSPPDLHWMKLNGTFEWLEPLEEEIAREMELHNGAEEDRPVATPGQYNSLAEQAKELSLTLPQGLQTFLTSNRLHHRMPSYDAWFFKVSKIITCPPSIDKGAGGYIMRFHWEQQAYAFAYLYMNPSGDHCVVRSYVDAYMAMDPEVGAKGEDRNREELEELWDGDPDDMINENFVIAGLTFEEYLVSTYYLELLRFGAKITQGLKEYVSHVYQRLVDVK